MSPRLTNGLFFGLGIAASCHSLPLPEDNLNPTPDHSASGASDVGAAATGGSSSPDAPTAGRDAGVGSGGRPSRPNETGGTSDELAEGAGAAGQGSTAPGPFDGVSRCTSGTVRDPNESEAPEMNPGFPCIFCHTASNAATGEGDAPIFAFAGTLYPSAHEPNSCKGSSGEGAEVVIHDAADVELRAVANTSGNFLLEDAVLTPPYSLKVLFQGRERPAATMHQIADCNLCHTETGDHGAPGRVVLP